MGVVEEDPPHIQSGSTRKRNSRDKVKPHNQEEEEAKKKKIIKKSEIIMSLTDLPSNVLVEILARLPLRTLFVARSVCKTFGFLTTANPHFIDLHSSYAAQILVFQFSSSHTPSSLLRIADNELGYKDSQLKPPSRLLRVADHDLDYNDSQLIPPLFKLPKKGTYFLVNSCNGLLYFMRSGYKDLHSLVCNPVTNEYIIIPDALPDPNIRSYMSLWLGFSPGTDQYKLLRILQWRNGNPNEIAAQVYVIGGSDSWRDIDDTPPWNRPVMNLAQAQLVNGLMYLHHWSWPSVISFDFEREKFGEVALPDKYQDEGFIMTENWKSIGVLGGCLCLTWNNLYARHFDLWVMRKCGNQESWRKEFVVDKVVGSRGFPAHGEFKPLLFLPNGEILMQWNMKALVCYDPRTETLRYFMWHRRGDLGHKVVALTPSFVPLKDALKVDEVLTQLRPRGDENDEL